MLVRPDYTLASQTLEAIWQCILHHRQAVKNDWPTFEQQPVASIEPILRELNPKLKRCAVECGVWLSGCSGITAPDTGDIWLHPGLFWDVLSSINENSRDKLKTSWLLLRDTLCHELIHQNQRDREAENFAAYHKRQRTRNLGKSFHYCQATNRYEIQAHPYTDATRIRRCLRRSGGTASLAREKAMVMEENAHCLPCLFKKELLDAEDVPDAQRILGEYKSTAWAYLQDLHNQPEPEIPVPDIHGL